MRINKNSVRDVLSDLHDDQELLFMDGFDGCVAGVVRGFDGELVVAYDYHKVIETLMSEGMSEIDAIESMIITKPEHTSGRRRRYSSTHWR